MKYRVLFRAVAVSCVFGLVQAAQGAGLAKLAFSHLEGLATDAQPAEPAERIDFRLIALPRMNESQIRDLIGDLLIELELRKGYSGTVSNNSVLPPFPTRVVTVATAESRLQGRTKFVQFGYFLIPRRGPQLVIQGAIQTPDGAQQNNPDTSEQVIDKIITKILEDTYRAQTRMRLRDLQANVINLSYIDADSALAVLRAMGYTAISDDTPMPEDDAFRGRDIPLLRDSAFAEKPPGNAQGPAAAAGLLAAKPAISEDDVAIKNISNMSFSFDLGDPVKPPNSFSQPPSNPNQNNLAKKDGIKKGPPSSIDYERLPLIYKMPAPDSNAIGLVGATGSGGGSGDPQANALGGTMIPSAASPLSAAISSSTSQLLVLTHPDNPAQFLAIKQVLEQMIDKPARQVFVEGLVLEVSKEAIDELGIQWQNKSGSNTITLGSLVQKSTNIGQSALQFVRDTALSDPGQFIARINALVDRNKAEILSRPSILTLDNRQATIRVGTDIPIATSKDASSGAQSGRVAFSFQYLPTGILLNVRPRINQEGREISMVIDATVSSTVPGGDLRLTDPTTGVTLASAPSIATRRVQTYARIANNTPLIIGGLVSRDQTKQDDKIPGLGDVPVLGRLFGYERNGDARREVIIVLTPSIVTEEFRATKPQLPKDDDRFDQADMALFREAYRIRAEDLIDSQFIRFNRRLLTYREIANTVMARNSSLDRSDIFLQFQGTKVPGEFIFVSGMMSRMLTRLKAGENVNIDKLMFFEGVDGANFTRNSVGNLLKKMGDGKTPEGFFKKNPGKALTMRFTFARSSTEAGQWATEPLADIQVVDCPDRKAWRQLLWEKNQPEDGVQKYYTIVLQDESDIERLKTAIALKNTILNNGNERGMIFDNFLPGRMISMQQVSPEWERTLEGTIGRYFFFGELYYPAFLQAIEKSFHDLDAALRLPEMKKYLDGVSLP